MKRLLRNLLFCSFLLTAFLRAEECVLYPTKVKISSISVNENYLVVALSFDPWWQKGARTDEEFRNWFLSSRTQEQDNVAGYRVYYSSSSRIYEGSVSFGGWMTNAIIQLPINTKVINICVSAPQCFEGNPKYSPEYRIAAIIPPSNIRIK